MIYVKVMLIVKLQHIQRVTQMQLPKYVVSSLTFLQFNKAPFIQQIGIFQDFLKGAKGAATT